jgi:signal transduction histidine kinase/CheY-like chemotaxis protein
MITQWHDDLNDLAQYNSDARRYQHLSASNSAKNYGLSINQDERSFIELVDVKDYDNEFYVKVEKDLYTKQTKYIHRVRLDRLTTVIAIILQMLRLYFSDKVPQFTIWLCLFDLTQLATRPFDIPEWTTIPLLFIATTSSLIVFFVHDMAMIAAVTFVIFMTFGHILNIMSWSMLRKYALLESLASNLQKANEVKGLFVRNISHEYRSPLLSINGSIELLRDTPLNKTQNEYVSTIQSCSNILLKLIEDVLQFSQLDQTKDTMHLLHVSVFNLRQCVEHVRDIITSYAKRVNIKVHVTISNALDSHYKSDPIRLQQILLNMLTNAAKASPKNETIQLHVNEIEPDEVNRLKQFDNSYLTTDGPVKKDNCTFVAFEVTDHGRGIPSSQRSMLFRPFAKLDSYSDTKTAPSTGLGMVITAKMVQNLGGFITVESSTKEKDHGTSFRIILPLEEAAPDEIDVELNNQLIPPSLNVESEEAYMQDYKEYEQANNINDEPDEKENDLPMYHVLVAEDNMINLRVVCRLLNAGTLDMRFDVSSVSDGQELVDRIKEIMETGGTLPRVILTDLHMPRLNGCKAIQKIKEICTERIRFILFTADVTNEIENRKNIDRIIIKPIDGKELRQCIRDLILMDE